MSGTLPCRADTQCRPRFGDIWRCRRHVADMSPTCGAKRRITWFLTCSLWKVMIMALHPLHTHIRSSSYLYEAFHHLPLWLVVLRMQPQPDMCLGSQSQRSSGSLRRFARFLTCNVLKVIIGATHPLHIPIRSTSRT